MFVTWSPPSPLKKKDKLKLKSQSKLLDLGENPPSPPASKTTKRFLKMFGFGHTYFFLKMFQPPSASPKDFLNNFFCMLPRPFRIYWCLTKLMGEIGVSGTQ